MRTCKSWANLDFKCHAEQHGFITVGESMAIQSQKEEADINTIVRNFGVTGQLPQNVRVPTYGDFSGVSDYQEALHAIMEADKSFMAMPANVRERFQNDAGQFVEFCSDPANLEEMRKLGLAVPKAEPEGSAKGEQGA